MRYESIMLVEYKFSLCKQVLGERYVQKCVDKCRRIQRTQIPASTHNVMSKMSSCGYDFALRKKHSNLNIFFVV